MKKVSITIIALAFVAALFVAAPVGASDLNYGVFYKGNTGMFVISTAWVKAAEGDWAWPKARGKATMWKNQDSVYNDRFVVVYFDYKFGQPKDAKYLEEWCFDFGGEYYFPEQLVNQGRLIDSAHMKPNSTGYPNFIMKPQPLPADLEALLPPKS